MRLHPGEIAASGWRVEHLGSLVQRLMEAAPEARGRPRGVAVDGRGGAGKTVLVERLQCAVPASAVVHTDDVAWNHALFDWGQVMAENVLPPCTGVRRCAFDRRRGSSTKRPGTIDVPAGLDVVWVEGTGIIREELDALIDASIYVQADLDVQEQRLVERDGNTQEQQEHIARWLDEELPFMAREQPWAKATIIVAGASELEHDQDAVIVVGTAM